MYKRNNSVDTFFKLKPELTDKQRALFSAFNRLSQERRSESGIPYPIKERDIRYYQRNNGSCSYAPDLFITAIQLLDTEYINNKYSEIERKNKG